MENCRQSLISSWAQAGDGILEQVGTQVAESERERHGRQDDEGAFAKNSVVSLQWSVTANAAVTDVEELDAIGVAELADLIGQTVYVKLNTTNGEKNRNGTRQMLAGDAIISDVQYTAQNRQRSTCQITLTGKNNMLIDIRYIITADDHYIRTADGNIVMAAHDPNS